jgi:hypothetical protein
MALLIALRASVRCPRPNLRCSARPRLPRGPGPPWDHTRLDGLVASHIPGKDTTLHNKLQVLSRPLRRPLARVGWQWSPLSERDPVRLRLTLCGVGRWPMPRGRQHLRLCGMHRGAVPVVRDTTMLAGRVDHHRWRVWVHPRRRILGLRRRGHVRRGHHVGMGHVRWRAGVWSGVVVRWRGDGSVPVRVQRRANLSVGREEAIAPGTARPLEAGQRRWPSRDGALSGTAIPVLLALLILVLVLVIPKGIPTRPLPVIRWRSRAESDAGH